MTTQDFITPFCNGVWNAFQVGDEALLDRVLRHPRFTSAVHTSRQMAHRVGMAVGKFQSKPILTRLLADESLSQSAVTCSLVAAAELGNTDLVTLLLSDARANPATKIVLVDAGAQGGGVAPVVGDAGAQGGGRAQAPQAAHVAPDIVWIRAEGVRAADRYIDERWANMTTLAAAAQSGNSACVSLILCDPRITVAHVHCTIVIAARKRMVPRNTSALEVLLAYPGADPSTNDNAAIVAAAQGSNEDAIRVLMADPRVDPSANNNIAIRAAVQRGFVAAVDALLTDPRVDPSVNNNSVIRIAAWEDSVSIVERLLADERVDPTVSNNEALREAARSGHQYTVYVLLSDHRVTRLAVDRGQLRWMRGQHADTMVRAMRLDAWRRRRHAVTAYHAASY